MSKREPPLRRRNCGHARSARAGSRRPVLSQGSIPDILCGKGGQVMKDRELELLERLYREGERQRQEPPAPTAQQHMIPYTELPEDTSGGRGAREWNLYRREAGRLLAEGHEGRWVLIQGEA